MKHNLEQLYLFILDTENKWFFGCSNVNKWKTVFVKLLTSFVENSSKSMEKGIEYLLNMNSGSIYVYEPGTLPTKMIYYYLERVFIILDDPIFDPLTILPKRYLYGIQTNVILNYSFRAWSYVNICKNKKIKRFLRVSKKAKNLKNKNISTFCFFQISSFGWQNCGLTTKSHHPFLFYFRFRRKVKIVFFLYYFFLY